MKKAFIQKRFRQDQTQLIDFCNSVIDGFAVQGFDLSLRQLYYQCVARNVIPNCVDAYTALGKLITDARLAGLVDWERIVDRGRPLRKTTQWRSASDAVSSLGKKFKLDYWRDQPFYIEVMVEKQALEGVLLPTCNKLGIGFMANKGYSSVSCLYEASQRYLAARQNGKQVCVFYLGDHDPSGCDMTRDVRDRLALFCGEPVDVKRLALNKSQVDEHHLPPNPAKLSDSRSSTYVDKHGEYSWELDALPPQVLVNYVVNAVSRRLDMVAWQRSANRETISRRRLALVAKSLAKAERVKSKVVDDSATNELPEPPEPPQTPESSLPTPTDDQS
jgi:hypothetical protein